MENTEGNQASKSASEFSTIRLKRATIEKLRSQIQEKKSLDDILSILIEKAILLDEQKK